MNWKSMFRIIAKLDVKPPHVVKPVHFEGLRRMGSPNDLSKKYYDQGVDEIIYIDIVASLYRREILYQHLSQAIQGIFVPLAVGGGITSVKDCSKLFQSCADKVVINTHALQVDPSLISKAAELYGSQSVVVNIEAKRTSVDWVCYSDCGRIPSGKSVLEWVDEIQERGAGEIVLQSVDKDGRRKGFDSDLIKKVVMSSSIPVIAASGAGSKEHILEMYSSAGPAGVAISSLLHYDIETVGSIKTFLRKNGVRVSL
jgi:cyclase